MDCCKAGGPSGGGSAQETGLLSFENSGDPSAATRPRPQDDKDTKATRVDKGNDSGGEGGG